MTRPARALGRGIALVAVALAVVATSTSAYAEGPDATITGRVTTEIPGKVTVNLFTTAGMAAGQAISDMDGVYSFPSVAPGEYKVHFGFNGRFQWAHQKLGYSTATVISVAESAHVVVDETMMLPGVVEVHATDAATGQPVDAICAGMYPDPYQCGATNGVLQLSDFSGGPRTVYIRSSDGLHARQQVEGVTVTLGTVTRLEVSLKPTVAITTTVVDRATGDPVPGVCVAALPKVFGGVDDQTCQWNVNYTDEQGRITLGELPQNNYTLLAVPQDGVHGMQWVGASGGTGDQYAAAVIRTTAGSASAAPTVRLDPTASIAGTVRDATTGEAIGDGCARVLPSKTAYGQGQGCSFGDGSYTIDNLGPYRWPVQFFNFYSWASDPYVSVWSGGATDRKAATLVQAGVDTPGVVDANLTRVDAPLKLQVSSEDGQAYTGWFWVEIYNAQTGDLIRTTDTLQGWTIGGLGAQGVRIRYVPSPPWAAGWYKGSDFATANTVKLKVGETTTVKIVLPDPE